MELKALHVGYEPTDQKHWTGRTASAYNDAQYWHETIALLNLKDMASQNTDIALIGYACDEGVKRNLGRIGAVKGPDAIRERLGKLPIHFEKTQIADFGNIHCIDGDMEACQNGLAATITAMLAHGIFPIAIGGGHDIAYGHFKGIYNAVNTTANKKIGIINFDAHFDLRPVESVPNSGTPFYQILNEFDAVSYFAIGIQQQSNTKDLFDIAKSKHVHFAMNDACEASKEEIKNLQNCLQPFIDSCDYLYITIDMDGFSSAFAPGVSAPSPLGFGPNFLFKMLYFLLKSKKVISCDLAELNPRLDADNATANLAARLIDYIVMQVDKNQP